MAAVPNASNSFTPIVPPSIQLVSTTEIVSQLSDNLLYRASTPGDGCHTTTPTNESRATTPAISDLAEYVIDQEGSIDDCTQSVPDWYSLTIVEIYDEINPSTSIGKEKLRKWRDRVVDGAGNPLSKIGIVANRLLKVLVQKKMLKDCQQNTKLQTKKMLRNEQCNEFLLLNQSLPAGQLIRKFLAENIVLPINVNGEVIDTAVVSVNLLARVIMLAVEPEPFQQLSDIFAAAEKDAHRAQVDDKVLSFNEKWNSLANHFFNASDFQPENDFVDADSRISDIDPRSAPALPWTGESLQKTFHGLKTKFALVDDMFSRSGNLEAGADIDEADCFDGHVKRVLENESPTLHKVMLFPFWVFNKKPPKFISRAKPPQQQFDSSSQAAESADSRNQKPYKRVRVGSETDALAKAVSALAPNDKEQKL
jgi:hypothetical protein